VFEVGSSLRRARERQGLTLAEAERATRINPRYLRALEEERFADLPGDAYARSFLREYADFLGLEAQPFVDEFDARFATHEEPSIAPRGLPHRTSLGRYVGLALAGLALAGLAVWVLGARDGERTATEMPTFGVAATTTAVVQSPPARRRKPAKVVTLVLTAARGRCWLAVHMDTAAGRTLWEGTLEQGSTVRFRGRRLWLRIGWPPVLDARVDGRSVALPGRTASVIVTGKGLRST
jgi:transcriptional regulator with XRE-family HTH domain